MKATALKFLNKTTAKVGAVVTAATYLGNQAMITYCKPTTGITAMDKLTDLIIKVMAWAGFIMLAVGLAMTVKAIINSTSGQSQPGELGKALGLAGGGAVLLVIDVALGLIGA